MLHPSSITGDRAGHSRRVTQQSIPPGLLIYSSSRDRSPPLQHLHSRVASSPEVLCQHHAQQKGATGNKAFACAAFPKARVKDGLGDARLALKISHGVNSKPALDFSKAVGKFINIPSSALAQPTSMLSPIQMSKAGSSADSSLSVPS